MCTTVWKSQGLEWEDAKPVPGTCILAPKYIVLLPFPREGPMRTVWCGFNLGLYWDIKVGTRELKVRE